jgi:threonine/homoserine/homoserine lactone efflux protein
VTNPQTALFFAGTLTVAIPPETPIMVRLACVGSIVVASLLCHGGTAVMVSAERGRIFLLRFKPFIDLLLGALLIAFAMRMLTGIANQL